MNHLLRFFVVFLLCFWINQQNCLAQAVGVGSTQFVPSATLEVRSTGNTNGTYGFKLSNSSSSPLIFIQDDGNVGVGTSSPLFKLHVVGTVDPAAVVVEGVGAVGPNFIGRRANGTPAAKTAVTSFQNLAIFGAEGYGSSGFSGVGPMIRLTAVENWTDASQGAEMIFYTTPVGSNVGQDYMYLNSNGNLGIGTVAPAAQLHTTGSVRFANYTNGILSVDGSGNLTVGAAGSYGWLTTGNSGTTAGMNFIGTTDAQDFVVKTSGSEAMRITVNGNVGIGQTSPSVYRLEVDGSSGDVAVSENFQPAAELVIGNKTNTNGNYSMLGFINHAGEHDAGIQGVHVNANGQYANNDRSGELRFAVSGPTTNGDITTKMIINKNGTLGVGQIDNPYGSLHISKNTGYFNGAVTAINKANTYLMLGGDESTAGHVHIIGFGYTANDVGSSTYMPAYMGYVTTSTNSYQQGDLVFGTRDVTTDSSPSERMRINSDGNVGIGTTGPVEALQIGDRFAFQNGGWKVIEYNVRYNPVSGNDEYIVNDKATRICFTSTGQLRFQVAPTGVAGADAGNSFSEGIIVANNSNVGIGGSFASGAALPASRLAVNAGMAVGSGYYSTNAAPNDGLIVQGNVGIGTSIPAAMLSVKGTSGTSESLSYSGPDRSDFTSALSQSWIDIAQNSFTTRNTSAGKYAALSGVMEDNLTSNGKSLFGALGFANNTATSGNGGGVYGTGGDAYNSDAGNLVNAWGTYGTAANLSSGNVTSLYGLYGSTYNSGSGTVANMSVIRAGKATNSGGGTVSNLYGLYIDDQTVGTSNFQLYSHGASPSYFGGNIGIGSTSPANALDVVGSICYTGAIGACSDARYKKNITPVTGALSNVLKLNGVHYNWKTTEFPDKKFTNDLQLGFIAQDLEKIYPELVLTDDKGYKSVDYAKLTPVLVEAIKELSNEVQQQKIMQQKTIDELMHEVQMLKMQLNTKH